MDNAVDAMHGRGELTLRTSLKDQTVVVEIEDNGPGIPPDIQQRIFEPFFTTKPPGSGTGLGLHIAYTIINNHNGRIGVESKPGKTIFRFTLPIQLPRQFEHYLPVVDNYRCLPIPLPRNPSFFPSIKDPPRR